MTEELSFIMMIALGVMLIVFSISAKRQKEYRDEEFLRDHLKWERERTKQEKQGSQKQPKSESKPRTKEKAKSAEVIDSLDWMLMNQIISSQEYAKIMLKCLPFFE